MVKTISSRTASCPAGSTASNVLANVPPADAACGMPCTSPVDGSIKKARRWVPDRESDFGLVAAAGVAVLKLLVVNRSNVVHCADGAINRAN